MLPPFPAAPVHSPYCYHHNSGSWQASQYPLQIGPREKFQHHNLSSGGVWYTGAGMNDSGALPPSVKLPTLPARDARAHWTDEEVAYALGLVMQGYTYARAAAVMKEEWGYEVIELHSDEIINKFKNRFVR